MSLDRIVQIREAVDRLCAAIDAGDIALTEGQMMAVALVVEREAGPLKHDLLVKLASRCREGQSALRKMAH